MLLGWAGLEDKGPVTASPQQQKLLTTRSRRGRVRVEILMEDAEGKHPAGAALGTQEKTFNK